jgi:hypothetical protein
MVSRSKENVQNIQEVPEYLSPRELAVVAQVSESSVKRWCDRGLIAFERTGGGHRRMKLADAIGFLKSSGKPFDPSRLGLAEPLPGTASESQAVERLTEAFLLGDLEDAERWTSHLYFAKWSIGRICDDAIAESFRRIGERWACRTAEVFQERRACTLAHRLLDRLAKLVPIPGVGAPLAIGAAPGGDPYSLPIAMCEVALQESGWKATSLGVGLPFDTLAAAVDQFKPRFFWLSVSAIDDVDEFLSGWRQFTETIGDGVATVGGGRALTPEIRRTIPFTIYADDVRRLQTFARVVNAPPASPT